MDKVAELNRISGILYSKMTDEIERLGITELNEFIEFELNLYLHMISTHLFSIHQNLNIPLNVPVDGFKQMIDTNISNLRNRYHN